MRLVFFFLLFANILMLVWRFGLGLPAKYRAPLDSEVWQRPSNLRGLTLVGEEVAPDSELTSSFEALCVWVGPFGREQTAQTFIERIAALDVQSALKVEPVAAGESYWVYLPSPGNRTAAKGILAKLQGRGIDSYIVPKGEQENAISLGMFSELKLAQTRMAEIVDLGFEPLLKSITRQVDEFWVMVEEAQVEKIGKSAWHNIVTEQFKLSEEQKFCLDVASK